MIWILKKFVKDGDRVLDPMAGIFTTGIEGMRLFPNSLFIGIDLEQKFVDMAKANIKKVEAIAKKDMFMKIGKALAVQGDARQLQKLLNEKVNKVITSPPFQQAGTDTEKRMKKRLDKVFKGRSYVPTQKYRDKENISNIKPYGQVNKIISSPPFGQAQSGGGIAKKGYDGPKHGPTDLVGKRSYMPENIGDRDNISNLPYGQTDKIISSPPFGGQVQHKTNYLGKQKKESGFEYSDNPENIGNMPHSQSLTGKTYLSEMLKIYQQCYRILKPQGLMILITKDFIRNKKRIHLGEDTVKLCRMTGFKYLKTYHRKIEHPSFWRTLYHQKFPEVEKINSEDILVFQKEK